MIAYYNTNYQNLLVINESKIIDSIVDNFNNSDFISYVQKKFDFSPKFFFNQVLKKEKDTQNKLKRIEIQIKNAGIDLEKIKNISKRTATQMISDIKKDPKSFSLNKSFQRLAADINNELNLFGKITISLLLTVFIFSFNSFFFTFFTTLFGAKVGVLLTTIVIAPLIEETGKMLSIQESATGSFFIIFNAAEWAFWVNNLMNLGVPFSQAAMTRLLPVLLHGFLTLIHMSAKKEDTKDVVEKWGIAVLFHGLWNTFASLKIFGV